GVHGMTRQLLSTGGDGQRCRRRPWVGGLLLAALAGCQTPAAPLTACDAADGRARRQALLAGHILCDSVSEMACHPLRGTRLLLSDPVCFLGAAGRGLFGKRLALRLLGPPGPVAGCGTPACCGSPEENLRP